MPDSCDLLPGSLRYAATQELLALVAPRPLLLLGGGDGPLEYATDLYRWSEGVHKLRHRPETDWSAMARVEVYSWLSRWIANGVSVTSFREPVEWAEPVAVEFGDSVATAPSKRAPVSEDLLNTVLGAPLPDGSLSYALNCGTRSAQRINFYAQAGVKIPVTALRPGPDECSASRGTLVAVDDRGRSALPDAPVVREAIRRGWLVWMLDPRGIGELQSKREPFVFAASLMLGENLTWRQSADILRLLRRVAGSGDRYPTGLYAKGKNMGVAASYVAAIADRRELHWVVLEDAAVSLHELRDVPSSVVPFGALKWFDMKDLFDAAQTKPLVVTDPTAFLQSEW